MHNNILVISTTSVLSEIASDILSLSVHLFIATFSVYTFVWVERNTRSFKGQTEPKKGPTTAGGPRQLNLPISGILFLLVPWSFTDIKICHEILTTSKGVT